MRAVRGLRGSHRRGWRAVSVLIAVLIATVGSGAALAACARVQPSTAGCVGAPDPLISGLGGRLTVAASLRNGEMVRAVTSPPDYFISAELVRKGLSTHTRGPILTWFGPPTSPTALSAVDANARRYSSLRRGGHVADGGPAMESRGCTYRLLGSVPNTRCIGISGALASLCQKANKTGGP